MGLRPIADEARGILGRIDNCFQHKPIRRRIAQGIDRFDLNAHDIVSCMQAGVARMRHIPPILDKLESPLLNEKWKSFDRVLRDLTIVPADCRPRVDERHAGFS